MRTKMLLARMAMLAMMVMATFSCSKHSKSTVTPTGALDAVATSWHTSAWGGVSDNYLTFKIDAGTATGTVSSVSLNSFGFAVGDKILTDIKANSDGSFSATGKYTYGASSEHSGTRPAKITLQNSGSQMTITYPAISALFPEVVYVYQKGTVA